MSNTHTHTLAVNLSGKHFPVTLKAWELCYFKFQLFYGFNYTVNHFLMHIYIYTHTHNLFFIVATFAVSHFSLKQLNTDT